MRTFTGEGWRLLEEICLVPIEIIIKMLYLIVFYIRSTQFILKNLLKISILNHELKCAKMLLLLSNFIFNHVYKTLTYYFINAVYCSPVF